MTNQPTHKAKTIYDQWVEGWYDGSDKNDLVIWMPHPNAYYSIIPSTLCRSTYRPDSNGKLMYEGDEVEVKREMFDIIEASGIYTIVWDDVLCSFYMVADGKYHLTFNTEDDYYLTGKNKRD